MTLAACTGASVMSPKRMAILSSRVDDILSTRPRNFSPLLIHWLPMQISKTRINQLSRCHHNQQLPDLTNSLLRKTTDGSNSRRVLERGFQFNLQTSFNSSTSFRLLILRGIHRPLKATRNKLIGSSNIRNQRFNRSVIRELILNNFQRQPCHLNGRVLGKHRVERLANRM